MFNDFTFPDGTHPHWEAVNWLQKRYMRWLNKERTKTLLTFPVITVCCLTDDKDVLDKEYKDFITTQWAEGDSFFVYLSQNADSISSCCRLRNEVTDNTLYKRAVHSQKSVEEIVIENERNKIIHNVINGLRKSQKTKLIKYYFEEKTEEEIAKEENMTQQAISKGLELAKENFGHTFRKKFKKF